MYPARLMASVGAAGPGLGPAGPATLGPGPGCPNEAGGRSMTM